MGKISIEAKNVLDQVFTGSSSSYSVFTVLGGYREEVEPVVVKGIEKGLFDADDLCGDEPHKDGFSFYVWNVNPSIARFFSSHLNNRLVIGETSWDCTEVSIFFNGKKALPGKDYQIDLKYELNMDVPGEEVIYYDTDYIISDTYGNEMSSGAGHITEEDLLRLKSLKLNLTKNQIVERIQDAEAKAWEEYETAVTMNGGRDGSTLSYAMKQRHAAIRDLMEQLGIEKKGMSLDEKLSMASQKANKPIHNISKIKEKDSLKGR